MSAASECGDLDSTLAAGPGERCVLRAATVSIAEAAERLGVTHRTLRFYEEKGLVQSSRTRHGSRVYDNDNMTRLRFICQARAATLTVREIAMVLDPEGPNHQKVTALAKKKLVEFERQRQRIEMALSALACGDSAR